MSDSLQPHTVHGILQDRILEWVAIPFSRGSSQPRDQTQVFHIARWILYQLSHQGFPGGTSGKEPASQCRRQRDVGLTPGSGRSPEEGHGNPLQYSFLKNSKDRGAWQAIVHRVAKSWTKLSTHARVYKCVQLCVLRVIEIMLFYVWFSDKFDTV